MQTKSEFHASRDGIYPWRHSTQSNVLMRQSIRELKIEYGLEEDGTFRSAAPKEHNSMFCLSTMNFCKETLNEGVQWVNGVHFFEDTSLMYVLSLKPVASVEHVLKNMSCYQISATYIATSTCR